MGTGAHVMTSSLPASLALMLLMTACHGPPIMSRIQPRVQPRAAPFAADPRTPSAQRAPLRTDQVRRRRPDVLTAPFLSKEGKPGSIVTNKMIADIERAVRLRQEARRPPADPCSQASERARRLKYRAGVGQEERGSIEIPCPPELLKQLWNKLAK